MNLTPITRPDGSIYRPRKLIAHAVTSHGDELTGVVVFGTHDIEVAQPLADDYVAWLIDKGHRAAGPGTVWWRDGINGGERTWVLDDKRGRAGVWFSEIVEAAP